MIPKSQKTSEGAGDREAATSHTLFEEILNCFFKMLLIMKKYYPKSQFRVAGPTLSCPPSFLSLE